MIKCAVKERPEKITYKQLSVNYGGYFVPLHLFGECEPQKDANNRFCSNNTK